jgi:hypothetical protein
MLERGTEIPEANPMAFALETIVDVDTMIAEEVCGKELLFIHATSLVVTNKTHEIVVRNAKKHNINPSSTFALELFVRCMAAFYAMANDQLQ